MILRLSLSTGIPPLLATKVEWRSLSVSALSASPPWPLPAISGRVGGGQSNSDSLPASLKNKKEDDDVFNFETLFSKWYKKFLKRQRNNFGWIIWSEFDSKFVSSALIPEDQRPNICSRLSWVKIRRRRRLSNVKTSRDEFSIALAKKNSRLVFLGHLFCTGPLRPGKCNSRQGWFSF